MNQYIYPISVNLYWQDMKIQQPKTYRNQYRSHLQHLGRPLGLRAIVPPSRRNFDPKPDRLVVVFGMICLDLVSLVSGELINQ